MKQTLFRAKDKNTKRWCYGFYDNKFKTYFFNDKEKHCIDADTVSQYTGIECYVPLVGKNQVCDLPRKKQKLFEGDILKIPNRKNNAEIGVVKYCYADSCYCVYVKSNKNKIYLNELEPTSEIIGNVWDNNELFSENINEE